MIELSPSQNLDYQRDSQSPRNQSPTKLIATTDMRIVSMIEFKGKIYLAAEHAVFVHDPAKGDFDFQQMQFVHIPPDEILP